MSNPHPIGPYMCSAWSFGIVLKNIPEWVPEGPPALEATPEQVIEQRIRVTRYMHDCGHWGPGLRGAR